ncbi:RagB/SusD family nutrient uptake outer membrane protein [Pedobacter hiemivivus]|uniref:RagB/SusD family nutrient uptake outer membrane protein n=1 Tax=Pedobacter hiemivivus TaxID=2530454 RepID=A0A4R0MBN9_9SPHI|nr:RagB/SusD family nutrient uptake outer membrane protein [Pedobacter hiemivivus]TCC83745.1 RagB/SusD family nutrient uptake outer membrane protein [Pedobacter hiemivivus]
MKAISTYFTAFATGLILLSASSCKKALEETPYSFYSPENFYKNESDAKTAINGVYAELYTYDLYLQPFWNMTILDDDHVSGADWFLGTTGAGNPQAYFGWEKPWVGCYAIIARANTVLENVVNINNMDGDIKNRILGEAYFLRGWAYFQLVQLYGGVPIRLKSLSATEPQTNIPRATVKETYDVVISDFKNAETKLFPVGHAKAGEVGRVNQGVAKAFLAKTYLTMASGAATGNVTVRGGTDNGYYTYVKTVVAGHEGIDSKAFYTLARDKAAEVITDNQYALTPSWKDLWSIAGRNNKEQMWELQSLAGTAFVNNLSAYFPARSTFGQGAVWTTNNHYNDYELLDKRVLDGITHNYTTLQGTNIFYPFAQASLYKVVGGITYNNTNTTTAERAYTIKFSSVADPSVANSDAFFPLLRYSEVLLMYAEAENEVNGATTLAYNALNTVRFRSYPTTGTPAVPVPAAYAPANMNPEQFRSYVLAERAREFNLEGIRRFDLMRWGIYLQVMNKISTGQNNITKVRANRNLLLPLPLSELNANKAIPGNNPGW